MITTTPGAGVEAHPAVEIPDPRPHYTTDGDVRGPCGHKHRSKATAMACLRKDKRACHSYHGFSDRDIYLVHGDGERTPVTITDHYPQF